MKARALDLHVPTAEPPPDRGRLLDAATIARELFNDQVSPTWVMRNVKGAQSGRLKLGHSTVRFWEKDVRRWLELRMATKGAA